MSISYWNPADKHADISLYNSNTTAQCDTGNQRSVRSTHSRATGKYYFEVQLSSGTAGATFAIGLARSTMDLADFVGAGADGFSYHGNGDFYDEGVSAGVSGYSMAADDRIGVAVDLDTGDVWFTVNGLEPVSSSATLDNTNRAIVGSATGTLFPAFSTFQGDLAGTGYWLAADLAALPSGFSAWDTGAVLPETCESNAVATSTVATVAQMTLAFTSDAVAADTAKVGHGHTFTDSAVASSSVSFRRGVSLNSNVVAQSTLTGIGHHSITLASNAVARSEAIGLLTLLLSSTAEAQSEVSFKRTVSLESNAVAVVTANAKHTTKIGTTAVATAVADGRRAFLLASTAIATDSVIGQRKVAVTLTSDAVAASTVSGTAHITMLLASNAVASSHAATIAHMMVTLESNAEAESRVRFTDAALPVLWLNTTTAAAAAWDGVLVNSMIEDGGNVYGAGPAGLYVITPKEKDAGARIPVSVRWDLTDFGTAHRKRLGAVYVSGYAKDGFTVNVVNHQGAFDYTARLPGHAHASNYRALPGKGLDSQYYRIGVDSRGYCECNAVIVDFLETSRRI